MNRKILSSGILMAFLLSLLATPLAMAEESVVGVVFRGWSEAECRNTFGGNIPVTSNVNTLGIENEFRESRGPLIFGDLETGCYCGKDTQGRDYVLSEDKTTCTMCSRYDINALYYTDANAEKAAVIRVRGEDIGCRCAKTRGNLDFDRIVNGRCEYIDKTVQKQKCQAQFGTEGVKVCNDLAGETFLGFSDDGAVECCCETDYDKKQDATKKGGYSCNKDSDTTTTGNANSICAAAAKAYGKGENWVEDGTFYTENVDTTKRSKLSEEEKLRWESCQSLPGAYADDGSQLTCCCKTGYVMDNEGKCVPDVDECGQTIPGSVKKGRSDASIYKIGDTYAGLEWETSKLEQLNKKDLECYCKKTTIPADNSPNPKLAGGKEEKLHVLDSCAQVNSCSDLFLGTVSSVSPDAGTVLVGQGWDPDKLTVMESLDLECACPKGQVAHKSTGSNYYDVCALDEMYCIDTEDMTSLLKVGLCNSKKKGSEFPFDFRERTAVAFLGNQDVVIKTKSQNAIGKIALDGVGYGLLRAFGVRDLWYMGVRGLSAQGDCSELIPADEDDFKGSIAWMNCLARLPCDQMPDLNGDIIAGKGTAPLRTVGGIRVGSRLASFESAAVADDIARAVENVMSVVQDGTEQVRILGQTSDEALAAARSAAARVAVGEDASRLITEATQLASDTRNSLTVAENSLTTANSRLADLADTLSSLGFDPANPSTPAGSLMDDVSNGVLHLDDSIDSARVLSDGLTSAARSADSTADIITFAAAHTDDITKTTDSLTDLVRLTDGLTDASRISSVASSVSKSRNLAALKAVGDFVKKPFKAIGRTRIGGGIARISKTGLRYLGNALMVYSVIDGVSAGALNAFSKDLEILPDKELAKASISAPLTIPTSKRSPGGYSELYGITVMSLETTGGSANIPGLQGGVFDITWTANVAKPPPFEGMTYKCDCSGSANCGADNKLFGCKCYPITNRIPVEFDKARSGAGYSF